MADLAALETKTLDLLDEVFTQQGKQPARAVLASVAQLTTDLANRTQERDTAIGERNAKQAAINGMLADLSSSKTADAAEDAGRDAAIAKGQAA